jgi:hypothetical protein
MLKELPSFPIDSYNLSGLTSFICSSLTGDIPASNASALCYLNLIVASKLAASPMAALAIEENLFTSSSGFFLTGSLMIESYSIAD